MQKGFLEKILKTGRVSLFLGYTVLVAATVVVFIPFLWLISSSFKTSDEIFSSHQSFLPASPTLDNYVRLFQDVPFLQFMVNSVFVTTSATLLTLLLCGLGGYGFAKFVFKGKDQFFMVLLGTMMIPFQVLLVPLFGFLFKIGWVDSFAGVIVPFIASAFGVFLMRQYMLSVPDDIIEAARIDGCGELRIFFQIVLPVVKPGLGALTIYIFMQSWNNFIWPLIVLRDEMKYTLPVGLANLLGIYQQEYGMVMAGSLISVVPVIILFIVMQKEFVEGLTAGATKG
jgi:ABC-type glycerol-3-phosphate transport system permease component